VDEKRQAQAMSILNITYLVGIAFGPFVGGLANDTFSGDLPVGSAERYVPSFFVAAACFAVAAVVAYFVAPTREVTHPHPEPQDHHAEALGEGGPAAAHTPTFSLAAVRKAVRVVPMLLLLGFITFLGIGLIAPYVKLFAMKRYSISESTFGTLLLYPALLIAALAVPLGKLSDTWGKARSIHWGMGVCALSLWLILLIEREWAVIVLGSLLGIGFVLAFPAYMAYIADTAGPRERGGMIGAFRMAQGFGAMLGTYLSPLLYKLDEEHLTLFIVAGALLSVAFVLSVFYVRERPPAGTAESPPPPPPAAPAAV
jgi:MFS family permease